MSDKKKAETKRLVAESKRRADKRRAIESAKNKAEIKATANKSDVLLAKFIRMRKSGKIKYGKATSAKSATAKRVYKRKAK